MAGSIVVTLSRQLSWSHVVLLLPLKAQLARELYAEMTRVQRWSVRRLRAQIDSMLYERTAPRTLATTSTPSAPA